MRWPTCWAVRQLPLLASSTDMQTDGNVVLYTNYGTKVWANGQ
jgi:hypothetical protein